MIYHVLPELEPFSMYRGGAISKILACIMSHDGSRVVTSRHADKSFGYGEDRVLILPWLHAYRRIPGRRFLPLWIHRPLLCLVFLPFLSRLESNDIVWCHNQPFFSAALERAIHLKGAKLIYYSQDGHANYAVRAAFRSFTADAYIFVSDAIQRKWLKLFPWLKNTYTIHNGADERLFYPKPAETSRSNAVPIVLYVGRLHPEKGVHVLMDAIEILNERKVDVLCKVAGSSFSGGSKVTPYVKSLLKSSPENVQFEGYRIQTQLAQEYRAADILCCPSIWQEPFGNVNIEAMACGVPVVATRVGGIPEIAAGGGVLLVEPDSAVQLADALQRLVEDGELRMKVGREGLKSFQRQFTWTAIYRQYQEVVNRLGTC